MSGAALLAAKIRCASRDASRIERLDTDSHNPLDTGFAESEMHLPFIHVPSEIFNEPVMTAAIDEDNEYLNRLTNKSKRGAAQLLSTILKHRSHNLKLKSLSKLRLHATQSSSSLRVKAAADDLEALELVLQKLLPGKNEEEMRSYD